MTLSKQPRHPRTSAILQWLFFIASYIKNHLQQATTLAYDITAKRLHNILRSKIKYQFRNLLSIQILIQHLSLRKAQLINLRCTIQALLLYTVITLLHPKKEKTTGVPLQLLAILLLLLYNINNTTEINNITLMSLNSENNTNNFQIIDDDGTKKGWGIATIQELGVINKIHNYDATTRQYLLHNYYIYSNCANEKNLLHTQKIKKEKELLGKLRRKQITKAKYLCELKKIQACTPRRHSVSL